MFYARPQEILSVNPLEVHDHLLGGSDLVSLCHRLGVLCDFHWLQHSQGLGPISPQQKLVQQNWNIPAMFNMDMFQSTFLFVKKLYTRFQSTIF